MAPVHPMLWATSTFLPGEPEDFESKEEIKQPDPGTAPPAHAPSPGWRPGHTRHLLKERTKQKAPETTTKEERAKARRTEKERQKALAPKRAQAGGNPSRFFMDQARAKKPAETKSSVPSGGGPGTWWEDKEDGRGLVTATSGGKSFTRNDIIPLLGAYYILPEDLDHIQKRHYSEHLEADDPSRFSSIVVGREGIQGLLQGLLAQPPVAVFPSSSEGGGGGSQYLDGDSQISTYYLEGAGTVHARLPGQADIHTDYVRIVTRWHDLGDGSTFLVKTAYPCLYVPRETKSPSGFLPRPDRKR
ncbi:MAG: hypothetical protein P4L36_03060 [Holophaga sp.]|nr:hypothetical protein [Holophaga sp.]